MNTNLELLNKLLEQHMVIVRELRAETGEDVLTKMDPEAEFNLMPYGAAGVAVEMITASEDRLNLLGHAISQKSVSDEVLGRFLRLMVNTHLTLDQY